MLKDTRIAIVGMGCVFPGGKGAEGFWDLIARRGDASEDVPEGRWPAAAAHYDHATLGQADRVASRRGYFVPREHYDTSDLPLDPAVLRGLDPLFHLTLRAGFDAWNDCPTAVKHRARAGVIMGNIILPTEGSAKVARSYLGQSFVESLLSHAGSEVAPPTEVDPRNAFPAALPASLLAKMLGLEKGSYTLDAACASSLYALKLARDELLSGRLDVVVSGGVSRPDPLYTQMGFSQLHALSQRGRSAPFDATADGLVVGEGAGLFILKRLDDALQDGDRIYGLLSGIGLANDIGGSLMAPNSEGQLRAMHRAYAQAGWQPSDVDYIECHATGTPLGDGVELKSLKTLWQDAPMGARCVISSVKGNVGHLLTAAGASGLARILLALQNDTLPATANYKGSLPKLGLETSPFRILQKAEFWRKSPNTPRRAAISGFGFGGINAHALIEEWIPHRPALPGPAPVNKRVAIVAAAAEVGPYKNAELAARLFQGHPETATQPASWHQSSQSHWWQALWSKGTAPQSLAPETLSVPFGVFRIPPTELREMLPQQLLMLKVAADALIQAGYDKADKVTAGVFIGIALDAGASRFQGRWQWSAEWESWAASLGLSLTPEQGANWLASLRDAYHPALTANRTMGALGGIVASRIAREFHFGGPSFTLSADELSGLRALDVAANSIARGELSMALVGAVDGAAQLEVALARQRWALQAGKDVNPIYNQGAVAFVLRPADDVPAEQILAIWNGSEFSTNSTTLESPSPFGFTGAASGLLDVWSDVTRLSRRLSKDRAYWFQNREDGPRRTSTITTAMNGEAATTLLEGGSSLPALGIGHAMSLERLYATENSDSPAKSLIVSCATPTFNPDRPEMATISDRPEMATISDRPEMATISDRPELATMSSVPVQPRQESLMKMETSASTAFAAALVREMIATERATMAAHSAQLSMSAAQMQAAGNVLSVPWSLANFPQLDRPGKKKAEPALFDFAACQEFARGSIARVLGPQFASIDAHPTRVRLPDGPLLLCHRIMAMEAEPGSMGSGRLVTEHDVVADAWYLDQGKIPTAIAVESGQADLFLSAVLGIDFKTKGLAVYRLLDAVVTFYRALPQVGDTIRYDIRIDHFFNQGETTLFRFSFEATVNGEPLMSMKQGCAGFFTQEELAMGKGVVKTALDLRPMTGTVTGGFQRPVTSLPNTMSDAKIEALRDGDYAKAFGPSFRDLPIRDPARLPGGMMRLVHRILSMSANGGRFGLGQVRGEADIHPDDWFLTCHFVDDKVMPGTLMYECCLHTLRVYLMAMGWVGEAVDLVAEPIPGMASQLKCRGQVLTSTEKVTYEITPKEIGYRPEAYVIVDALMYADGKPIVEITNMTLHFAGYTKAKCEAIWQDQKAPRPAFGPEHITAYAEGKPSEAFGEPYKIFDDVNGRKLARLPRPPYQFLDRIVNVQAEPWHMVAGGRLLGAYDVPPDAWYFDAERTETMPFAVLLEIALQPCGFFAAYLGSALTSETDLSFRNLGGKAIQHRTVTRDCGTLLTQITITKVSQSGGMIIQDYTFCVRDGEGRLIYEGTTVFGFFSKEALAQQVGVRGAKLPYGQRLVAPLTYPDRATLPMAPILMVDAISAFDPSGGDHGCGYLRGTKRVKPEEWFFAAHFYQDPVMPGSLGLEAFLQVMKVAATERWGTEMGQSLPSIALGTEHEWVYRGQVIPTNDEMSVDVSVQSYDDKTQTMTADGFLSVDGKVIYQMKKFTIGFG